METKVCNTCTQEKGLECFSIDKTKKSGYLGKCKQCRREYRQAESARQKRKEYQERPDIREKRKQNKQKPEYKEKQREYNKTDKRKESRIKFMSKARNKIGHNISKGIRKAIKQNKQNLHWETLVDYTLLELMQHLETKFDEHMNWDNYGSYWHIDHIEPQSWFEFSSNEEQAFKDCWSLSNLQPLEATKNISKGNRFKG